ncbi:MAG TPA: outer membrane beta-barrel protein [Candidatus Aquilonibacter sp.]|nr:outer membrane beta-barrel protein [Candidatus Aquilonibacter sp.]
MIRIAVAIIGIVVLVVVFIGPCAIAQAAADQAPADQAPAPEPATPALPVVVPMVQVFGGYSFIYEGLRNLNATFLDTDLNLYPRTLIPQTNFNGWNAEGQYNVNPWVGAVVDFSGTTTMPFIAGTGVTGVPTGSSYSIMAGPAVSYRKLKKITPFIHALFGWNRTSLSAGTLKSSTPIGTTPFPVSSVGATFTDFALAFGAGVDYKISRRFSLRAVQVDWYRTSLNLNSFYGTAFNNTLVQGFENKERNLRVSTGVVVNFK